MNERKPEKYLRPGTSAKPPRSISMTQTEAEMRAAHSRLSRDVQRKLGETLQGMFDEIVKEGVPDRFVKLLEQIEEGRRVGSADEHANQFTKSNERDATSERDAIGSPDPLGESESRKSGKEGQG